MHCSRLEVNTSTSMVGSMHRHAAVGTPSLCAGEHCVSRVGAVHQMGGCEERERLVQGPHCTAQIRLQRTVRSRRVTWYSLPHKRVGVLHRRSLLVHVLQNLGKLLNRLVGLPIHCRVLWVRVVLLQMLRLQSLVLCWGQDELLRELGHVCWTFLREVCVRMHLLCAWLYLCTCPPAEPTT